MSDGLNLRPLFVQPKWLGVVKLTRFLPYGKGSAPCFKNEPDETLSWNNLSIDVFKNRFGENPFMKWLNARFVKWNGRNPYPVNIPNALKTDWGDEWGNYLRKSWFLETLQKNPVRQSKVYTNSSFGEDQLSLVLHWMFRLVYLPWFGKREMDIALELED